MEHFTDIWVSGEISGTKLAASGHYYFTLKDEAAQIRSVCYKMTARYLKFKPQDGVAVLARGRLGSIRRPRRSCNWWWRRWSRRATARSNSPSSS